ncbi:2-oxoacid:ferredoxin oxidoreductase subunit beta, partial [Mycobacterium tuberculosis]|nr:2-oxoacid:ferredoxin oxidoreductase subunit beta [Mycobacterium tuberculosis]
VVMDNAVYGMTKGQASPTTEADWGNSKLTPGGTGVEPVEPVRLALAAGAGFVARGFAGNTAETADLILAGMRHPGFAFIHVLSPCVTY